MNPPYLHQQQHRAGRGIALKSGVLRIRSHDGVSGSHGTGSSRNAAPSLLPALGRGDSLYTSTMKGAVVITISTLFVLLVVLPSRRRWLLRRLSESPGLSSGKQSPRPCSPSSPSSIASSISTTSSTSVGSSVTSSASGRVLTVTFSSGSSKRAYQATSSATTTSSATPSAWPHCCCWFKCASVGLSLPWHWHTGRRGTSYDGFGSDSRATAAAQAKADV
jgi:hypothetical protein